MAKPRSPILGYNHNVRYRGLVFHVQTEDSGIQNPHVFTHLFHGGVILSTRKLVYDPSASDDTVKALMQAQHKAVLKDLKRTQFDDKIDQYLGGTPGLLPRGQSDGEVGVDSGVFDTAPVAPPPLADPPPAQSRTPTPPPSSISIPAPARISGRINVVGAPTDSVEARAPTERFATDLHPSPPSLPPPPAQSMTPPPVQTRPAEVLAAGDPGQAPGVRRDVSAAFQAIMVGDGEVAPGGALADAADADSGPVIEIHSAAPGSAPPPPGAAPPTRPGEYAQHRKRDSAPPAPADLATPGRPTTRTPPIARPTSPPPRAATTAGVPPPPRTSTPTGSTPAITRPPAAGVTRPTSPPATYPSGRSTSSVPPMGRGSAPPRTRSPSSGGGVVVTRPAVIVGAPARTVGGTTGAAPPAAPPSASPPPPPAAAARPPSTRVRKAREDTDSGLFGQDLISEKSLDEVILAYLSEDPADE